MLSRDEIIKRLREGTPYLAGEYGVKRIGLFGSYARNTAITGSDIDLVVEFDRPIGFKFIDLTEYLEDLLETKVDLLTKTGLTGIRVPHVAEEIEANILYV